MTKQVAISLLVAGVLAVIGDCHKIQADLAAGCGDKRRGLFTIGAVGMHMHITFIRAAGEEVFADGWLKEGLAWGRPVDVQAMPDGALLVSDDKAGLIYRISYGGR